MPDHPTPPSGESAPPSLEERAREIIWRIAVWQDDDEDPCGNCTWAYALEYEDEMGELVPRTIDAAREVHALYAAEVARLTAGWEAEVRRTAELREAMDAAGILRQRVNGRLWAIPARESAQLAAAEARAARAEEALAGERRIVRSLQGQLDEERRTFPAEGVWLVTDQPGDRHARRIAPVSALPDAVPLAELYLREDQVTRAVDALREEIMGTVQHDADGGVRWTYPAARDVARSILRALERRALPEGGANAEK